MFTVRGKLGEQPVVVNWREPNILGANSMVLMLIAARAQELEAAGQGCNIRTEWPCEVTRNMLSDPRSALIIIADVLDEITGIDGEMPEFTVSKAGYV